ncbi:MAG: ABC transporter permease [Rhodospirillaceae bacterium]|jgi:putative spermidine/putrescine transport system permease protein|nr:ABC transporter permease [Rhodospirillaceae bacterium]MBT4425580.1 ABC transporter permease [Rhodospirillaceae bacterium]MBT5674585.1 ABC transporter permease [Rhodospirillaceae bacterium]MBT5781037.1 ABC transporter permease [Rhodospirillaceae bacterium]
MRDGIKRAPGYWPRATLFYLYLLFLYGPIIIIVLLSFQADNASLSFPMQGFSLFYFGEVFDPQYIGDFRWPFGRSVILGLISMVLTMGISFLAGLAFRKNFKGNIIVFYVVVASLICPSILISLGIGIGFSNLGLVSQWWSGGLGAHLSWTLPFGVLIMLAVFSRLDPRLEEAARDQGASQWQTLRNVTIPITLPGLVGVALFGFTLSYDEYPRISNVAGEDNSLPVELVNALSLAATPTIYAIGTMTTLFSLTIIFSTFLVVYFMAKRRQGLGLKKAKAEG